MHTNPTYPGGNAGKYLRCKMWRGSLRLAAHRISNVPGYSSWYPVQRLRCHCPPEAIAHGYVEGIGRYIHTEYVRSMHCTWTWRDAGVLRHVIAHFGSWKRPWQRPNGVGGAVICLFLQGLDRDRHLDLV